MPGPVSAVANSKRNTASRVPWRLVRRILLVLVLLPVVLTPVYKFVPPVSTLMIWNAVIGNGAERDWVGFDRIAKALVVSVIVSEDARFCEHRGVDWTELNKVVSDDEGPSRGASTIAMQTVKNLYLCNSRSYLRKGLEIPLALYGDFVWGKRREIELYLNVAEFGRGIFGAEAAAQHYFKRPAKDLSASQAALLAATLPSPFSRDPAHPSRNLQALARTIAARARLAGPYIVCLYP
jgi:monofunctional biosynthetic peptidoglycan transglycosylase